MSRSRFFLCGFLALTVACSDGGNLDPLGPADLPDAVGPQALISDAVHSVGGNEHFFWLPPMVGDPGGSNGVFNGVLSPTVEICEWDDGSQSCAIPLVATFTMDTGPGSETVRVVPEDEHYIVNWHTGDEAFDVAPGATYRITAFAADTELGIADIQLGATGHEVQNLTTGEIIGLKDGRTLPIKFRIEQGGAAFVFDIPATTGGTVDALDGEVTIDLPAGALQVDTEITVEPIDPTAGALAAVEFGPPGTTFVTPVDVTLGYEAAALGGVAESDLALNLLDGAGRWVIIPGSVVDDIADEVSAPFHHFSTGGAGPAALAVFCPGDGDPNTFDDLQAAIDAVMVDGTVEVCDDTQPHTIADARIDKQMTLEGEFGTRPILTTADASRWGLRIGAGSPAMSGTVTVRNLHFRTEWSQQYYTASALYLSLRHDQVLVDNVTLEVTDWGSAAVVRSSFVAGHAVIQNATVTGPGQVGVFVWLRGGDGDVDIRDSSFNGLSFTNARVQTTAPSTGRVTFDNITSTGTGANLGVWALNSIADLGPVVDVLNSSFTGEAVWYQQGASGLIQNNTFDGCHFRACVRSAGGAAPQLQAEPVRVVDNQITGRWAGESDYGIFLSAPTAGPFEIRNNTISGVAPSGVRSDSLTYNFHRDGIEIDNSDVAGVVSDNSISSAYHGIRTDGGTVQVTGLDNTVDAVWTGVRVTNGGQMSIQSSNFTDYVVPISPNEPFSTGDLTCNWWDDANGPVGVDPGIARGVYTPWATGSVAGTGTTSCDGGLITMSLDVGIGSICAVTTLADAYCWGYNFQGQLGNGSNVGSNVPVPVSGGLIFQSVSHKWRHACGVTNAGAAYCWGLNSSGQLGDGTMTDSNVPVPVSGGLTFQAISAGNKHTCGLTTAGVAYCWGTGYLGNGMNRSRSTVPVAVSGGLTFQSVSSGSEHTCGLTTAGVAYCWGFNNGGQLGDGTTTARLTPVAVSGGLAFQSVSAHHHTCGVTTMGAAYCWGNNLGRLGDGTTTHRLTPVAVSGGLTFQSVSAGLHHSCGVTTAGAAYCWGENVNGKLGDGTNTARNVPVAVIGGLTLQSVSGGSDHSCGLTTAGAAYCWGENFDGQLGDGNHNTHSNVPVAVTGGLTLQSVTAGGGRHNCGLTAAGAAYCWGHNLNGQLGVGPVPSSRVPVAVSGGLTFQLVSGGHQHSCGMTTAGAAFCWGFNFFGQLGNSTNTDSNVPVLVRVP